MWDTLYNMKRLKTFLTLPLLLYFACFVVLPISAVIPSLKSQDISEGQDYIGKQGSKADILLFDLALWEIIKKAKRTDDLKTIVPCKGEKGSTVIYAKAGDTVMVSLSALSMFSKKIQFYTLDDLFTFKSLRFTHSGWSPPFLL